MNPKLRRNGSLTALARAQLPLSKERLRALATTYLHFFSPRDEGKWWCMIVLMLLLHGLKEHQGHTTIAHDCSDVCYCMD